MGPSSTQRRVVVAGRTGPNHLVRFGESDVALDDRGRSDVEALGLTFTSVICGPELATRETASLVSTAVIVDAGLASLDVGKWAGRLPEEIPGSELGAWFGDPASRPHGGETVVAFVDRIKAWALRAPSSAIVVAGPVAQALLCDGSESFFAVQVVPGCCYDA
ncbi:MAG: histidine phosphatase family protein [Gordonia sp. (in: high G+C Gram-positive bacteria)]|nr:MAG: histidine phosphatase family protein [Gordonia sp. (in: high G+C Gram-positive bacteria)]